MMTRKWTDSKTNYALVICEFGIRTQRLISRYLDHRLIPEVKHLQEIDKQLLQLLHKAGFDRNQPRVPAGNSDGGQWADAPSWGYTAQDSIAAPAYRFKTSRYGVQFISTHEKFRSEVYPDQGGLSTIGYGHLLLSGESFPDGISHEEALDLLAKDIGIAERAVQRNVRVRITQSQFDALTSLTYNIGAQAFANSTLLKLLNQDKVREAADEFSKWNKVRVNGKPVISNGLAKHRKQEREIFLLFLENSE